MNAQSHIISDRSLTMTVPVLSLILAMLTAFIAPRSSLAQDRADINVSIDCPAKMYLGDTSDLAIVIRGSKRVEAPDLSTLADFTAVYRAPQDMSSTTTTIMNGQVDTKTTITFSHLYAISPKRIGTLTIPPIDVVVDGRTYTTPPRTIEVVQPTSAKDFQLAIEVEPPSAFVGQPIHVHLKWTLGRNVRDLNFTLPIEGVEHDVYAPPEPKPGVGGTFDDRYVRVPFNGEPAFVQLQGNVVTLDRYIVPKAPGTLHIGPARVDFKVAVGERQRTWLDSPFEDRSIYDRQYSVSEAASLRVSALPVTGKPKNFSGLVGSYVLDARVDATNVSVGDPINLSVTINGPYPLSLVPPLDLSTQPALKSFRVPREPLLGQVIAGLGPLVYTGMIRARASSQNVIAPIELNYFDPVKGEYAVMCSKPIALSIADSGTIALPDDASQPQVQPTQELRRPGGLPDLARDMPGWSPRVVSMNAAISSRFARWTMVVLGLLVLLPPIVVVLSDALRQDPTQRRRAKAVKHCLRGLRELSQKSPSLDQLALVLSNFVSDLAGRPRNVLTGPHAANLARSLAKDSAADLSNLLFELDAIRFAAGARQAPDFTALVSRAAASVRACKLPSNPTPTPDTINPALDAGFGRAST